MVQCDALSLQTIKGEKRETQQNIAVQPLHALLSLTQYIFSQTTLFSIVLSSLTNSGLGAPNSGTHFPSLPYPMAWSFYFLDFFSLFSPSLSRETNFILGCFQGSLRECTRPFTLSRSMWGTRSSRELWTGRTYPATLAWSSPRIRNHGSGGLRSSTRGSWTRWPSSVALTVRIPSATSLVLILFLALVVFLFNLFLLTFYGSYGYSQMLCFAVLDCGLVIGFFSLQESWRLRFFCCQDFGVELKWL